jgi:hypothetical protein
VTPAKNCRPKYFRITLTTLRIPVDSRPSVTFVRLPQTHASGRKGKRCANGPSDQPLVTTAGAGAFPIGYLPTGLLPIGYLPTGAVETTGWGCGRSAATAVPTKARVATPRITNFNIEVSAANRGNLEFPDSVELTSHSRREQWIDCRTNSLASRFLSDVAKMARNLRHLVPAWCFPQT